jgi:3-hydroxyacyl-[acyl-carrier-protein] dehydratase
MRFYLLDRITKMTLGESISGLKCWSMTDDYLNEHFPGFPIVPGVLVTESMAQLMGTLVEKTFNQKFPNDGGVYAVLTIIHKAKFKKFLIPGDQAKMEGEIVSFDKNMATGKVRVYVDGELFNQAELTFGLIPMEKIANPRLIEMRDEYFNLLMNGKDARDNLRSAKRS